MLVHKIWTTVKKTKFSKFYFQGHHYNCRERHWEGWFLFGLIPLVMKNTKTVYSNVWMML